MMHKYKYISCSSAGTQGLMYIGAIRAFEEYCRDEFWNNLIGFVGTSAGTIASLAILLRLSHKQLMTIATKPVKCLQHF